MFRQGKIPDKKVKKRPVVCINAFSSDIQKILPKRRVLQEICKVSEWRGGAWMWKKNCFYCKENYIMGNGGKCNKMMEEKCDACKSKGILSYRIRKNM